MPQIYFSKEHEWIEVDQEIGTVGITQYAQEQLGDIVFAEVTKLKEKVSRNDDVAVVESVFKITVDTPQELQELMDEATYKKFIEELN